MAQRDDAERMLQAQFVQRYRTDLKAVWWKLIRIRNSLNAMRHIHEFPLARLVTPDGLYFWQLIVDNFGDVVVLHLHHLVGDQDARSLNLRRFANDVRDWLAPEHVDWYQRRLRDAKLDRSLADVLARVKELRDRSIAHHERAGETPLPGIKEAEIEELYAQVKRLFDVVALNTEYLVDLDERGIGDVRQSEVERVLALVAKDSRFVNQPERHGDAWPLIRAHKPAGQLQEMNELRARLGMPQA